MHTVIAAFDDRQDAQRAFERLIESGFSRDMVHLQARSDGVSTRTDSSVTDTSNDSRGFFEGIRQFFADLFGTDEPAGESGRYAEAIRRGGTVVIVDAADEAEADKARETLDAMGGTIDLEERATHWTREGWTGFDANARYTAAGTDTAQPVAATGRQVGEQPSVMPVVQEELQVGKRAVSKGGVRVTQRVTETPVKEMIRLREERAIVERRPADRPASEADFANFKEGTIEVRETREEPVVSKAARVVEEVVVGKQVDERTETVSDTVRRTDVEVEQLGGQAGARTSESADRRSDTAGDELDRDRIGSPSQTRR
jgi:uncharacterized protein (TIGR02271 family)